jgi:methyl-accepting chemotaxis protein
MDFHVQNITAGITEQTGAMLKDILEQNTQVLEQYKDNTTNLLQSFDEQARSIGLYAKEMNFDITELSANLRESVATFTTGVREGIELTVGDFDKSLAELSERLAVTVEGISDAVEHLPAAINARGGR